MLLDSKEFNSLTSTLSLVRPSCLQAPRPKRFGVSEQFGFADSSAAINHNTNSVNWTRVTSKSGSWGGQSQSTTSVASAMPAINNNTGKNALIHSSQFAAQTC
jgi:hypothetical protein